MFENPTDGVADGTIDHNLKGAREISSARRTGRLLGPLEAIDKIWANKPKLDVLSVGPRTEMELFHLCGYGFDPRRVRGLDLVSSSPMIDIGDMHQMPYEDNRFDLIICGWALAYSDDRARAMREFVRVTKPGGVIAVGNTYTPQEQRGENSVGVLSVADAKVDTYLDYVRESVDQVYFRHGAPDNQEGRVIFIFDVKK